MPITLSKDDQDKYNRILADVNAARGNSFTKPPSQEDLLNTVYQLVGNNGTEQEILKRLQQAAVHKTLLTNEGDTAYKIHRDLFYMGYVDSPPRGIDKPEERAKNAEQAIGKFLEKHPECQNMTAKDMLAKLEDTMWYEKKQPGAKANAEKWGAISYGGGDGFSGYDEGLYADFEKQIGNELRGSANATFGGPDGVKKVQALLYMRYPKEFDPQHDDRWHGIDRKPNGEWSMYDQQLLQRFTEEENKNRYGSNPIPPATAMRWGGSDEAHRSDVQAQFGQRVLLGLVNSQAGLGKYNLDHRPQTAQINPTADGNVSTAEVARMQLYLKAGGYYKTMEAPTGNWSETDKQAMQLWLDDSNHKRSGFAHFFGASDPYPHTTDNMSSADFKKVLEAARKESEEKYGLTSDVTELLVHNHEEQEPPTPDLDKATGRAPAETKTTPDKTPETERKPDPEPSKGGNGNYISHDHSNQISNADIAKMQAQLHFTDGYNGKFTGNIADAKDALTDFAKKYNVDISKGLDDADTQKRLIAEVQKRFDDWAKNKDNAAKLKDVMDKGWDVGYGQSPDDSVREMQKAVLAMGGPLNKWGVDGVRGPETTGAIDALKGPDGIYKKILDAAGIAMGPDSKPTDKPADDNTGTKPKIANIWEDPTDDPFGGDGGFIKPAPAIEPAPVVAVPQEQPASTKRNDFKKAATNGQPDAQVVSPESVQAGPGKAPGLPPRGQMTSYFNEKGESNKGMAIAHFSAYRTSDYVYDSLKSQGNTLVPVPLGGDHGNQGAVFVIGPDGRFATKFNVNGNYDPRTGQYFDPATHASFDPKYGNSDPNHPGMPVTTYTNKVYDLQDPKDLKEFNHEIEKAEHRQQDKLADLGATPGPLMAVPPVMDRRQWFGPQVYGPNIYTPGGVNLDVRVRGGR